MKKIGLDVLMVEIEPTMVSGFLYGEENRHFRSKVWNELAKSVWVVLLQKVNVTLQC